jgi:alkylated DNA repair dioxygenase AlkB
LPDPAVASIGAEIETGSFERLPEQTGPYGVREDAELLRIPPDDTMRYPTVVRLRADLTHLVHQHGGGLAGLDKWEPNDIAAMRYRAGSFGITPHRDSKRYRGLIAIFTTEGSAPFTFCANREGDIIDKWNAAPGSLILMRGTSLNGAENRPFHAVAGPTTGSRVSLTFRMSDG